MKEYWPTIVAGAVTGVVCFIISLAEPPEVFSQSASHEPLQKQSQVQFIVVPEAPTEAELREETFKELTREVLARNK